MKFRLILAAVVLGALSSCTTTGGGAPSNAVEARWLGKPAGTFFAKFGPPTSDVESGATTTYAWRGGFKSARIPAEYAKGSEGQGKPIRPARIARLSCSLKITVNSDYTIRDIQTVSDPRGEKGGSYCAELTAGDN